MKEISILTVLIVRIAAVGSIFIVASVCAPYELIFITDHTTELTGSISLQCRDANTAEPVSVNEALFFLNHSLVAHPGILEREDIRVVVGRYELRFNLTRRLEGYYTCGRRVNATYVEESLPLILASLQTTVPLPDPPPQTNFTAVSGDRVVLPCPIQPGALTQYYSVEWSIENSTVVIVDTQNIVTVDDSRYNSDRATYSLIIDPVNINDTSTRYGCKLFVTNPNTNTREQLQLSPPVSLSLHVIDLPTTPSMEFTPATPLAEELSAVVASMISMLVTLTAVIIVVMVVVILYFAGTRCRRGQLIIYDTPYNYQLPPLPPRMLRMDSGNYDTISNISKDDLQKQLLESNSLDNKLDDETIAANRCLINSFNDESVEATNGIAISQFLSTNPDTAKDSATHSIGIDSPSERDNLPLNLATDDRAENPNDELGLVPSPNVIENVSHQPSTRFSLERNPAYGTDIAIAPEIETDANVAYKSNVQSLPTTNHDAAVSASPSPSSVHSAETDLPLDRADDGTDLPPLNPGLGEATEDSTGSNVSTH